MSTAWIGFKVAVFRSLGHHVPRTHIAAVVALSDLIKGLPRAKVAPAHAQRYNCRQIRMFHNGRIYGIRRGGKKGLAVRVRKCLIILAIAPDGFADSVNLRSKTLQLIQTLANMEAAASAAGFSTKQATR